MTVSSRLEQRGRELSEMLGGHWSKSKGMARCPAHDDRTPSLGLRLGSHAILLHCFAGCMTSDVLQALERRGIPTRSLFDGNTGKFVTTAAPHGPDANAVRLWRAAAPAKGTLAAAYLESRAIRAPSKELRFLPRTPFGPRGRTEWLPAMIAAVRTDAGVIAIQRTFLTPAGDIAGMSRPKRGLGSYGIGAVRLSPLAAGRLGLAEGIESALSASCLQGIPCWATLGNARFGIVAIPDSVTQLHLFLDGDSGGDLAEVRSLEAYSRSDRTIIPHRPPPPFLDWNDALRAGWST